MLSLVKYFLAAFSDPNDLFVAWYDEGTQLGNLVLIVGVVLVVIAIAAGIRLIYLRKRK